MLGFDPEPIHKAGYYVGGQVTYPVTSRVALGVTFTREELSRDDSLIKYLAANNLYGVEMGKKDRGTTLRVSVTCRGFRDSGSVLGGRVEPVSVGQRQLARIRSARLHRPRARSDTDWS